MPAELYNVPKFQLRSLDTKEQQKVPEQRPHCHVYTEAERLILNVQQLLKSWVDFKRYGALCSEHPLFLSLASLALRSLGFPVSSTVGNAWRRKKEFQKALMC